VHSFSEAKGDRFARSRPRSDFKPAYGPSD